MNKTPVRRLTALALALCIPLAALPAANAAPESADPTAEAVNTEAEQWQETLLREAQELEASSIPRHTVTHEGEDFLVYELENGMELAMPAYLTQPSPRLSAGPSVRGPWIELTPKEQRLAIAGSTGFITTALCAGTYGIACGLASAIGPAAALALSERGLCPNNRRALIEVTWSGQLRGFSCR
ncbi:hypothetical protein [Corynebacterium sp. AOP12-C2-36]|uniref:hypothetical protein n=1 Tax=Corynebacterium sp. AOP12-C2-36 TaxID=3457723 RepID=UPI004034AC6D